MILTIGKPNPKQDLFLRAKEKFIGFGGARGGGKSWAVRQKAKLLCLRWAGITVMIIRKTYPELIQNHVKTLISELGCYAEDKRLKIASYNDKDKTISFPNGSRILFRYCDTDKDADRLQGLEVDVLFIDEGTHFTEEQYKKMTACVRGVNNFPKHIYITCNPGGAGHEWVKRLFIDRHYKGAERAEDYTFIQSLVTDNTALMAADPDYLAQLEALPPKLRKAWLYGEWNIFQGAFFEEFRIEPSREDEEKTGLTAQQLKEQHRYTHVVPDFEPPEWWKYYRAYDFGYGKPFSVCYFAEDDNGTAYMIAEIYGCTDTPNEGVKQTPEEQFRTMREFEQQHPYLQGRKIRGVADPAIWDSSRGKSINEVAEEYRIYFEPGENKRIPGWMQVHQRLWFDSNGFAKLYFFESCRQAIRVFPLQMYDEHRAEDLDTAREDHIPDAVRYFCMMRKIKPRKTQNNSQKYKFDPLNQIKNLKYEVYYGN